MNQTLKNLRTLYQADHDHFKVTGESIPVAPELHTVAEWEAMYTLAHGLKLSAIERYNEIKPVRTQLAITAIVGDFAGDAADSLREKAAALDEISKWECAASCVYENLAAARAAAIRSTRRPAALRLAAAA
jgi:hypothetical protein